jgi:hypothetical protein
VSHINGRVRRWVNDGNSEGSNNGRDDPDSGWSHGTARRGDWTRLNRYEVTPPLSGVDGISGASDTSEASGHTGLADDYDVTLRCRLDMAALRYLAERADLLGLEIIEVRPAVAGGGHDG